jgi:uncharacterized protein YbgA (DUF1722 family)
MPQSQANVLLHVIFSTKNRAPFLTEKKLRDELNAYRVGTLQARLCPSLICGAWRIISMPLSGCRGR